MNKVFKNPAPATPMKDVTELNITRGFPVSLSEIGLKILLADRESRAPAVTAIT
jgi:hypothetical protein